MKSERQILRKHALFNQVDYQDIIESLKQLDLYELDYVRIADILVKRKSSVEESALKGILKQQGIPTCEIQPILTTYLKNRKQLKNK